jgi:hypothetical protein
LLSAKAIDSAINSDEPVLLSTEMDEQANILPDG